MTGSKHNLEGNTSDSGEPDPGPYWRRMHRDWRFWVGVLFLSVAIAVCTGTVDLMFVGTTNTSAAFPGPYPVQSQ